MSVIFDATLWVKHYIRVNFYAKLKYIVDVSLHFIRARVATSLDSQVSERLHAAFSLDIYDQIWTKAHPKIY